MRVLNGLATTEANIAITSVQDRQVEFSTSQVSSVPIVIPSDLVLPPLIRNSLSPGVQFRNEASHVAHPQISPKGL